MQTFLIIVGIFVVLICFYFILRSTNRKTPDVAPKVQEILSPENAHVASEIIPEPLEAVAPGKVSRQLSSPDKDKPFANLKSNEVKSDSGPVNPRPKPKPRPKKPKAETGSATTESVTKTEKPKAQPKPRKQKPKKTDPNK